MRDNPRPYKATTLAGSGERLRGLVDLGRRDFVPGAKGPQLWYGDITTFPTMERDGLNGHGESIGESRQVVGWSVR